MIISKGYLLICSRKHHETYQQYKEEIDALNIKLDASKCSEESILTEMQKLQDKHAKSQHLYDKVQYQREC